jgi:uncharacterized protein YyaL (SSP411 family)
MGVGLAGLFLVSSFFVIFRWKKINMFLQPEYTNSTLAQNNAVSQKHHKYTNHLIHETSPYLQQHAHNPVNWYAWGPEALAKAKEEDKPIFLSIGYSTCYWCHVMEKESFEKEEVAEILNKHFIAIKVDREERPDIDEQYMLATQLLVGRGGWPNSVWLTSDGRPWMAGTYFPKEQFIRVLETLAGYWKNRRPEIEQQADQLAQVIRQAASGGGLFRPGDDAGSLDQDLIEKAVVEYQQTFDDKHGGFGVEPKFPPHGVLGVLTEEHRRTQDESILRMITHTLDAMWLGGIHDHIGGGFHRYSTDSIWLVPHFEKMLYDNAQLMRAYTDGYLLSGATHYRQAVEDIFGWLEREMTSPEGGFYSAIDAGEVGKEGEFYLWHDKEIIKTLGDKDGRLFTDIYNVSKEGNFLEESTGRRTGANIVHLKTPLAEIAAARGEAPERFKNSIANLRNKLLVRRNTRPLPHKDDKILTSWNGLMIGSLAYAGRTLEERRYTEAAVKAADFILNHLVDDNGRLLRTYRVGQAKLGGYLDDYAYFAQGLLELYAATGEQRWLRRAQQLADTMLAEFEDKQAGGFFFTAASGEDILVRSKNLTGGGNIPAPNGTVAQVLLELNRLTGKQEYAESAKRTLETLLSLMRQGPRALDSGIQAAAVYLKHKPSEPVETAKNGQADVTKEFGPVTAHLFSSRQRVKPGQMFQLALALDIKEGWHLYGPNPEAAFLIPATVSVSENEMFTVGGIKEPSPQKKRDPVLKQVLATYESRIWYVIPVTIKGNIPDGQTTIKIGIKTQACDQNVCLPPRTDEIEFTLDIESNAPEGVIRHSEVFKTIETEKFL